MAGKRLHVFALMIVMICGAQAHYNSPPNAFHDVIHFTKTGLSDSTEFELPLNELEHIYEELFEKVECKEKAANCSSCLANLLAVADGISNLSTWNEVSTKVLYAVLNITDFCNMSESDMKSFNGTTSLVNLINGKETLDALGEEDIESILEMLSASFSGEEHHEEEAVTHHEETTTMHIQHSTKLDTAEEEHHEDAKCFGESSLLYYMGLDHEEPISLARVPEMAGVIMSFLVQDWVVDEACAVVPRQYDVIDSIFHTLAPQGDVIDEEGFEQLLETLNIGTASRDTSSQAPVDDGHGHKRSVDEEPLVEKCLGEGTLASIYDLDLEHGITRDEFIKLCPALIQQQISNSCVSAPISVQPAATEPPVTPTQTYGYGTLAVVIISLLALIGALLIPCLHSQVISYFLSMFVAMGVATMVGDALLHLLPQALGLHKHSEEDDEVHSNELIVSETTLVQLAVCAAIYGFYLFETVMSKFRPRSSKVFNHTHSHMPDLEMTKKEDKSIEDAANSVDNIKNTEQNSDRSSESSEHDLQAKSKPVCGSIPAVALMIVVGDGIHNFIDGIAIGAAFSLSVQDGIGTSIAVFCHELPHELGDFSILLKSGMTKGKAIMFNLIAASMCLLGLYVGAAIGKNEEARKWLIAITAGMFLYIALVDMLPELVAPAESGKWWIHFVMQNIGMFLGFGIMLLIAVYEEKIIHYQ